MLVTGWHCLFSHWSLIETVSVFKTLVTGWHCVYVFATLVTGWHCVYVFTTLVTGWHCVYVFRTLVTDWHCVSVFKTLVTGWHCVSVFTSLALRADCCTLSERFDSPLYRFRIQAVLIWSYLMPHRDSLVYCNQHGLAVFTLWKHESSLYLNAWTDPCNVLFICWYSELFNTIWRLPKLIRLTVTARHQPREPTIPVHGGRFPTLYCNQPATTDPGNPTATLTLEGQTGSAGQGEVRVTLTQLTSADNGRTVVCTASNAFTVHNNTPVTQRLQLQVYCEYSFFIQTTAHTGLLWVFFFIHQTTADTVLLWVFFFIDQTTAALLWVLVFIHQTTAATGLLWVLAFIHQTTAATGLLWVPVFIHQTAAATGLLWALFFIDITTADTGLLWVLVFIH